MSPTRVSPKSKSQRKPADHPMLATTPDPHHAPHEGEIGWDGHRFYYRTFVGRGTWQELKKLHPTPARVKTMYQLLNGAELEWLRGEVHGLRHENKRLQTEGLSCTCT